MVISFHDREDPNAHENFVRWCAANRGAFFINLRKPNFAIIHRVGCPHMTNWKREEHGSLTKSPKICAEDEQELRRWVDETVRASLKKCPRCDT